MMPTGQELNGTIVFSLNNLVSRGKHNGKVNDFQYFNTKDNANSGSLVKADKLNFGIELLEALLKKYFKDIQIDQD